MKKTSVLRLFLVILAAFTLFSTVAVAREQTRLSNPNVVGGEILGRGLLYGIFYDRAMSDVTAAGFSFGTVSNSLGSTALLIPAYFNYYFAKDESSVFATGGITLLANANSVVGTSPKVGNVTFSSGAVIPTAGLGFEDRGDAGFLFRATAYAMISSNLSLWAGFSFGYAF